MDGDLRETVGRARALTTAASRSPESVIAKRAYSRKLRAMARRRPVISFDAWELTVLTLVLGFLYWITWQRASARRPAPGAECARDRGLHRAVRPVSLLRARRGVDDPRLLPDRREGVFVDIGANHYRDASKTYYLETRLGWSGTPSSRSASTGPTTPSSGRTRSSCPSSSPMPRTPRPASTCSSRSR
jgi:hypothetical protein